MPVGYSWGLLVLFAVMLSTGQILFKLAAIRMPPIETAAGLLHIAFSPWAWLAFMMYGGASVLWIVLLQKIPLAVAYPFVSLGFVVVPLAAWVLFNEAISLRYLLGVAFILAGIYLTHSAMDR